MFKMKCLVSPLLSLPSSLCLSLSLSVCLCLSLSLSVDLWRLKDNYQKLVLSCHLVRLRDWAWVVRCMFKHYYSLFLFLGKHKWTSNHPRYQIWSGWLHQSPTDETTEYIVLVYRAHVKSLLQKCGNLIIATLMPCPTPCWMEASWILHYMSHFQS